MLASSSIDAVLSTTIDSSRHNSQRLKHRMHRIDGALHSTEHSKGSEALMQPILVNCSASDESDSGSDQTVHTVEENRTRIASVEAYSAPEPIPAAPIDVAHVQQGRHKTAVRYCMETWPKNIILQALDAFLAMSSMFGYTATLLIIPTLAGLAYMLPWKIPAWGFGTFVTGLVLSVFLPAEPLLWERFQHSTLVSSWRRYFNFSFAIEQKLDPHGKYIFAGFPHGVFPVSELLCISLLLKIWPAMRVYSIAASSVFNVPVWRHIMCWTGARPATRRWFRHLLSQGSVSLVPGGIAEMFLWEEHREIIKVRTRKGFVRIAVEQGVPLVPVYHFGNSKLFRYASPLFALKWQAAACWYPCISVTVSLQRCFNQILSFQC
eukprot:GHRR01000942.1.p1 GENE.GHRR01000942.1~~GHRR01000942.1.p1  ORF type:complete len:378 (+),score=36.87 GHRR01000942.1:444-1577(+)